MIAQVAVPGSVAEISAPKNISSWKLKPIPKIFVKMNINIPVIMQEAVVPMKTKAKILPVI